VVTVLERIEQHERALQAARLTTLAHGLEMLMELKRGPEKPGPSFELSYRALRAEVATALSVSEQTVDRELSLASTPIRQYPTVALALSSGEVSLAHTRVIADAGVIVNGDAKREAFTEQVLDIAAQETPGRLRPIARRLAESFAAETIATRHREARGQRRVCVYDGEDGMADLLAHLPAEQAHAIFDRLTQIGKRVQRAEAEHESRPAQPEIQVTTETPRCLDEIRADALSDLLLAADPPMVAGTGVEAIRGRVQVTVPLEGLLPGLGLEAEEANDSESTTAILSRHGPTSVEVARELAGAVGAWELARTDREGGTVISVDQYRPSERMKRLLVARDEHCRFPGCRVPAQRCDLDHTVDAARGGATATDNLAHLC